LIFKYKGAISLLERRGFPPNPHSCKWIIPLDTYIDLSNAEGLWKAIDDIGLFLGSHLELRQGTRLSLSHPKSAQNSEGVPNGNPPPSLSFAGSVRGEFDQGNPYSARKSALRTSVGITEFSK